MTELIQYLHNPGYEPHQSTNFLAVSRHSIKKTAEAIYRRLYRQSQIEEFNDETSEVEDSEGDRIDDPLLKQY